MKHVALLISVVTLSVMACSPAETGPDAADAADSIYTNGTIITVDADESIAEAVAVKDGKILTVGSAEVVMATRGENTQVVDLEGKTMTPGFIDAHGHLKNVGFQVLSANLLPPPDADVDSLAVLQEKLGQWGEGELSAKLGWIVGFGYDDSQLAEKRRKFTLS